MVEPGSSELLGGRSDRDCDHAFPLEKGIAKVVAEPILNVITIHSGGGLELVHSRNQAVTSEDFMEPDRRIVGNNDEGTKGESRTRVIAVIKEDGCHARSQVLRTALASAASVGIHGLSPRAPVSVGARA